MVSRELLYRVPTKQSTSNEWVNWHKTMKASFGKKNANILFVNAFAKRGSTSVVDENMQNYFEGQGIILDQNWLESAKGVFTDTYDFFSDVFKVGTYAAVGFGGVLLISLSVLIFNIARSAKASDVSSIVGGRK